MLYRIHDPDKVTSENLDKEHVWQTCLAFWGMWTNRDTCLAGGEANANYLLRQWADRISQVSRWLGEQHLPNEFIRIDLEGHYLLETVEEGEASSTSNVESVSTCAAPTFADFMSKLAEGESITINKSGRGVMINVVIHPTPPNTMQKNYTIIIGAAELRATREPADTVIYRNVLSCIETARHWE